MQSLGFICKMEIQTNYFVRGQIETCKEKKKKRQVKSQKNTVVKECEPMVQKMGLNPGFISVDVAWHPENLSGSLLHSSR